MPTETETTTNSVVFDYHLRTRHHYNAYAKGPGTLDWDAQPAPFRTYSGPTRISLPLLPDLAADSATQSAVGSALVQRLTQPFSHLFTCLQSLPLCIETLAAWLQMSLGVTAWKSLGPDRWAVRANPSSGNLHPIEAYLVIHGLSGLENGLYHYCPQHHALVLRASHHVTVDTPRVAVALTSVMWREMWKYGERAFRYCQLDAGHAMAALAHSACSLGWSLVENAAIGQTTLGRLCGVDRHAEFPARRFAETEREEPELLLQLNISDTPSPTLTAIEIAKFLTHAQWHGVASPIDPYPMYRWPLVAEVAAATQVPDHAMVAQTTAQVNCAVEVGDLRSIGSVILGRRSAQRFDGTWQLNRQALFVLLDALTKVGPWPVPAIQPAMGLCLFVLRVEDMQPGLYWLPLNQAAKSNPLPGWALPVMQEIPVDSCFWHAGESEKNLVLLTTFEHQNLQRLSRQLHCHQEIAGGCCVSLGIIAEFGKWINQNAGHYRHLLRLAGCYAHRLYLVAEAIGVRGTGIGCYFDNAAHEVFGIKDMAWQSLYHFTIGKPLEDKRIVSTPAYTREPDIY